MLTKKNWISNLKDYMKNILKYMIVKNVEIAVKNWV